MLEIIGFIAIVILVWTLVEVAYNASSMGRDDTDDPTGKRSNLQVHTDHLTGVQYLSGPRGGLVPRLDATGAPIIKVKK